MVVGVSPSRVLGALAALGVVGLFLGRKSGTIKRILIVGDSQSAGERTFGGNLATDLRKRGFEVEVLARVGAGVLTSGRSCDGRWFKDRLPALLARFKPQLVIVELGGNDAWCWGASDKKAKYQSEVKAFASAIKSSGSKVLWLGPSYASSSAGYQARRARIGAYQQEALKPLGIQWIDTVPFTQSLTRSSDGVHYPATSYREWATRMLAGPLSTLTA